MQLFFMKNEFLLDENQIIRINSMHKKSKFRVKMTHKF